MKKNLFLIVVLFIIIGSACKNSGKKKSGDGEMDTLQTRSEALYNDVIKGHDEGMGGWMHIENLQKQVRQMLDSITALPAKGQAAAASLKAKLTALSATLQTAYDEMDKWMNAINLDSAKENLEARIKYFTEEKMKVNKIKEDINSSLKLADSLLHSKH